ncbi:hypothetical protein [Chryseobacterium limigenitum]|uniref:Uncharacterized protein n=1 Tax=Chryseobacterium limigenitum TaxID=1612149 RepID=A0A1K2IUS8_9FLAO|nr:hypothetical protein [Chryseobacterium limigenitum]SFZ95491.1 hypothetical protein SAMN05216324_11059 [Chryseobacterium limigenitum]
MIFPKKITDILLKNGTVSVERKLDLTSTDLENYLLNLKYSGENLEKIKEIENAKLPAFITSFYYFVFSKLKIPSEKQFTELYYEINDFKFEGDDIIFQNKKFSKKGIEARLLRTYPSLIRDLHFYLLLSEDKSFDNVCYSLKTDYISGLDLKISFKNKEYFLSLHLGTERGKEFKLKKNDRHNYSNVPQIILEESLSNLKKHGDFGLFDKGHIKKLISELEHDNRK